MEAARITWRPLGRLLVERGLLTSDELELALAKQQQTGRRLGETIVECGFVSGPELASSLAAQYGLELTTEKGFGTGLRSEIQRRHESDRRKLVQLAPAPDDRQAPEPEPEPEPAPAETEDGESETPLLAQLEEQWAKLAAAEASLAERERELRELEEVNTRLRELVEELRRPPVDAAPAVPESHLVFAQLDDRYALLSYDGPPPLPSAALSLPELDDGVFVVAGSRRSPLPGDSRPCVFVQRAPSS